MVQRESYKDQIHSARKASAEQLDRAFQQKLSSRGTNAYLFDSLSQVRILSDQWRGHYNEKRPHEALQNLTPKDFLTNYGKASFSIAKNELNCTKPTVAN